jgi:hypothetical protein
MVFALGMLTGCASKPKHAAGPATTQATTAPAPPSVQSGNFIALWRACEDAAREFGFALDRQDYRGGVITTLPLISKQFFEVWFNDVQTAGDLAESSLATYRRTLRFDIRKTAVGGYTATPTVTIERYALAETPITSSVYLRNAFRPRTDQGMRGSPEADRGIILPRHYWYVTGEDEAVQKAVARRVKRKLR